MQQGSSGSTPSPKVVVFGGRGFVGSYVCQEALRSGLRVVGISRSGTPPASGAAWTRDVEWVRGNALVRPQGNWSLCILDLGLRCFD